MTELLNGSFIHLPQLLPQLRMVVPQLSQLIYPLKRAAPTRASVIYLIKAAPVIPTVIAYFQSLCFCNVPIHQRVLFTLNALRLVCRNANIVERLILALEPVDFFVDEVRFELAGTPSDFGTGPASETPSFSLFSMEDGFCFFSSNIRYSKPLGWRSIVKWIPRSR